MIELTGFGKDYGEFTAVESLDLKIGEGEMFGFIGPNGAGKSTSIRFLATLLRATRGDGTVNGYSVSQDPMNVRRSVGYMPDAFGVYDGMKVWEFLDFFAVAYKIGRTQRKQVIRDVLELLDLTYKRDDFVNGLSRGMKQRLCLAKTLVHDPPVLILDEPELGLHPYAIEVLGGLIASAATSIQVIAATQSTAFIDQFDTSGIVVVERSNRESQYKRLDEATLKDWLDEYSVSELWEKNVIGGRP